MNRNESYTLGEKFVSPIKRITCELGNKEERRTCKALQTVRSPRAKLLKVGFPSECDKSFIASDIPLVFQVMSSFLEKAAFSF